LNFTIILLSIDVIERIEFWVSIFDSSKLFDGLVTVLIFEFTVVLLLVWRLLTVITTCLLLIVYVVFKASWFDSTILNTFGWNCPIDIFSIPLIASFVDVLSLK